MAGENKRLSAASNVKALVTQPAGLKFIRKNMGLGDTLGPLEPGFGGLGAKPPMNIINPSASYYFKFRKVVAASASEDKKANCGCVNGKYAIVVHDSSSMVIRLDMFTDSGVKSTETLPETKASSSSKPKRSQFAYAENGTTYFAAPNNNKNVLYSWNKSGVKSVVYNDTMDNGNYGMNVDKDGNCISTRGIDSNNVMVVYRPLGGVKKTNKYNAGSSIYTSFAGNYLYVSSGNYVTGNGLAETFGVRCIDMKTEQLAAADVCKGTRGGLNVTKDGVFAYSDTSDFITMFRGLNAAETIPTPLYGGSMGLYANQYDSGQIANVDCCSELSLLGDVAMINGSMHTVNSAVSPHASGTKSGGRIVARCGGYYFALIEHDTLGNYAIYSFTLEKN